MNGQSKNPDGEDQFWKSRAINERYWKEYLDARPKYHTGDFYDRLLTYYRSHQNTSTSSSLPRVAHDVGTGPGQVAGILSKYFDEVVASDLNSTHLKAAESLLNTEGNESNFTLCLSGAEDISKHFAPYSAEFVAAAECMPLLNIPVAISGWADLLKPNGTLAMWFYGRPAFADDPDFDASACNGLYEQIANRAFRPFYDVSGQRLVNVRKAVDTMHSWLDNVDLDPGVWTDVRRLKWNTKYPMEFSHAGDLGWPVTHINNIHEGEKVEKVDDQDLWSETWTIEEWKKFLAVNLPDFDGSWDTETESLWAELGAKMGGSKTKRKVIWPVVAILATRRSDRSTSFWS